MVFLFEKSKLPIELVTKQEYHLFRMCSKKDRRKFAKFLNIVQFVVPNIRIELTCFPRIEDYHKYNFCDHSLTLKSEVIETVKLLTRDGYYVVAEVTLSS